MPVIVTATPEGGGRTLELDCPHNLTTPPVTVYTITGFEAHALAEAEATLGRNHVRTTGCSCLTEN